LEVGQELTYEGASSFKYDNRSMDHTQEWQLWVTKRNEDGSWRILVRNSMRYGGSPEVTFGYFDLFPDGRILSNPTLGYQLDPAALLVQLPADAKQTRAGWHSHDKLKALSRQHRLIERGDLQAGKLVVEVVNHSPMDEIYLSTSKSTFTVDGPRGLVERIETETTQGYGFNGKGTGTTELKSVVQRDADWMEKLTAEAMAYLEADKQYNELAERSQREPEKTAELLNEALSVLKQTRDRLTSAEMQSQLASRIEGHESLASYYKEAAQRRESVVGKPAYEFETTDLDGKPHVLEDYRGKVVILDFWYRGCGWCIRAMPQVKELAKSFEGQQVAVLGMNTDGDEKDALFVIDKMALNYPNLKATGLPEKYGVRGFPTLVIIDPKGTVRELHVGYSPDLAEKVSEAIKQLLAGS
jgi:peroxiredoxin